MMFLKLWVWTTCWARSLYLGEGLRASNENMNVGQISKGAILRLPWAATHPLLQPGVSALVQSDWVELFFCSGLGYESHTTFLLN